MLSGFLTALERTKSIFGRGSDPDSAGEAYSAPPGPVAGFKGSYILLREGRGGKRKKRERRERKRKGTGREGTGGEGGDAPNRNSWIRACVFVRRLKTMYDSEVPADADRAFQARAAATARNN